MAKRKMFDEPLEFGGRFSPPKTRKKRTTVKSVQKLFEGDPIFAGRIGPHKPKKVIRRKKSLATPLGFGSSGSRVRSKGKKNLSSFWSEPPKARKKKSTKKKVIPTGILLSKKDWYAEVNARWKNAPIGSKKPSKKELEAARLAQRRRILKSFKEKNEKTYTQKISRSGLSRGTILIDLPGPDLKIKTARRKTM